MFFLSAIPFVLLIIYRVTRWAQNYIHARRFGVPIVLLPVSYEELWWMPLRPLFTWVQYLPFGLGDWYLYTNLGWPTEDGNGSLHRYGENFVLCSPTSIVLVTSEAAVVETVFGGKNGAGFGGVAGEWHIPERDCQMFAVYGQNISSTNGEEWKRHRKITSSAFNESTMRRCWTESDAQAQKLSLQPDEHCDLAQVRSRFDVLAMRVLAIVGFGSNTNPSSVPPGHQESLLESLGFIVQHVMLTVLFHSLSAPDFILPRVLKRLKISVKEFMLHMEESVQHHTQNAHAEKPTARATSLLDSMIRANETNKTEHTEKPSFLTDSELYGNIFLFNVAGYETTSGTLTFALPYLAAYPEMQAWAAQEVLPLYENASVTTPDYAATYPQLVRCQAVMYETLRLATHALMFCKVSSTPATLTLHGSHNVTVPPGTLVGFNICGAHLSPLWGNDVMVFDPRRFIVTSADGEEKLQVPAGPLYAPWMMGPRVCPGKKFSQVEFVAVLARLLAGWRVEAVVEKGGSEKLKGVLGKKKVVIGTHLARPEEGWVRFVKRRE